MTAREHAVTAAWVAAGLLCVFMMMQHADLDAGGAVSRGETPRGRRLAGGGNGTFNDYAQAMRSISGVWNETALTSVNGLVGPAQLLISTGLVLVLGSLAAGAGIGGGGLFVPIYMVLLGAGPKGAVPLSKATILGGAVGNFISIGPSRHPKAKRPMIDYESSAFMQSGELLGVVFGVLLNNLLPAIVIVVFLVLILSYNAYKTINKGIKIRKKETAAMNKAKEAAEAEGGAVDAKGDRQVQKTPKTQTETPSRTANAVAAATEPAADAKQTEGVQLDQVHMYGSCVDVSKAVTSASSGESSADAPAGAGAVEGAAAMEEGKDAPKEVSTELQAIYDADSKQYPLWAWGLLIPMTAYTLMYAFVKNVIRRDPNCQEWSFWLWYVTPVPVLGGFMVYTAWLLSKRHKRKLAAGFPYLPADMQWDNSTLRRFPITALLAGLTAGLLGIGGGMVIGPLFLSIGMEPQVGTSSCAFMILWTAFSGVVIYGVDDHLGAELAVWCVSFGFVSGQIGQRLVNAVLKKTGRPSYVVFLLGSIIGAACIAMATTLIIKMITGDYDVNDVVEPDETVETHMFTMGTGFGCVGQ